RAQDRGPAARPRARKERYRADRGRRGLVPEGDHRDARGEDRPRGRRARRRDRAPRGRRRREPGASGRDRAPHRTSAARAAPGAVHGQRRDDRRCGVLRPPPSRDRDPGRGPQRHEARMTRLEDAIEAARVGATWLGLVSGTLKPWLAFTRGLVVCRAGLTELRWMQQVAERLQKAYAE